MRVLDLFSGIGGFSLGLERAGFQTVAFCEIDPFCRRVLAKHWPEVPCYDDVRTLSRARLADDGISGIDAICGGFPCQDISIAGRAAGIDGERSGLWGQYARLVRELRPRRVIVENVPMLLGRGIGRVLGDLADCGYDAEWQVVGADAIGASQHRERVWILAYPNDEGLQGPIWVGKPHEARPEWAAAHSEPLRSACGFWPPGPRAVDDVPRMVDGAPNRAQRLRALGNSVVPQIPELIGRALMESA
jgi:DNA (cytosine-5)-methyltransferase 1